MHQQQAVFENIVGKGEIARNEQFLLFPQCFLLNQIIVSAFVHIFDIISLFSSEFEKPKIAISGRGSKWLESITVKRRKYCLEVFLPFLLLFSDLKTVATDLPFFENLQNFTIFFCDSLLSDLTKYEIKKGNTSLGKIL